MAEAITFREIKLEGGWLMVKPEKQDIGKAMALVRRHKNMLYDLEVKEHREKRSKDANAYAWELIGKLAEKMGIKPVEVYRYAVQGIGGNYEMYEVNEEAAEEFKRLWSSQGLGWPCVDIGAAQRPGFRNLMAFHGSSTYDTKQMSRLIDSLVQDCKALDIETLPPEKLSLLVEGWK